MALLPLLFIIILECIVQYSIRHSGLAFENATGRFPAYVTFCYAYLPTIIGVLLALIWALVNNDIMRLEPYFQMSKPGGVDANQSLLLGYNYQTRFLVPFYAAKRGHWGVTVAGSVALLILRSPSNCYRFGGTSRRHGRHPIDELYIFN